MGPHSKENDEALTSLIAILTQAPAFNKNAADWATFEGKDGPGKGKHIVFVAGAMSKRSEEALRS